jgi:hypothetical protein
LLPANVENILKLVEEKSGTGAASRLRVFLGKCVYAGLRPKRTSKLSIPFRTKALVHRSYWTEPRRYWIAVFYFFRHRSQQGLSFPIHYYYRDVVGFDVNRLSEQLEVLGFHPFGKHQELRMDLNVHNDQAFFDGLFDLVVRTTDELTETLQR